jgi:hypothetical protein
MFLWASTWIDLKATNIMGLDSCNTHEFITNSKCPLCIPPQTQNLCYDMHNVVGNQLQLLIVNKRDYIGGHIDQTLQYINMQWNNTLGPSRPASTAQAKLIVGNEPNLQSHQWVLSSWSFSFKPDHVNSQGQSHEYIECSRKPSYK